MNQINLFHPAYVKIDRLLAHKKIESLQMDNSKIEEL